MRGVPGRCLSLLWPRAPCRSVTPRGHAPWQSLPSAEFEGVLHPVFEEDEWKLIAVGGLLGMWVGIFQALFVFGDSAAQ